MKIISIPALFLLVIFFANCNPYRHTNRSYKKQARKFARTLRAKPSGFDIHKPDYWVGTTNFGLRKPEFVIIHHTAQNSCPQTLRTFTLPRTQVSAHYVICKDGTVHHMLNDYLRAWHGGISRWGKMRDINSASIGIELDNNGFEPFSIRQLNSLIQLLDTLKKRYHIPAENFIGHADIAPKRKVDPNIYFPWHYLSMHGFGIWYGDTTDLTVPDGFDHLLALQLVGYDTRDTTAAILAFKRHFVHDTIPLINKRDDKILYSLLKQLH